MNFDPNRPEDENDAEQERKGKEALNIVLAWHAAHNSHDDPVTGERVHDAMSEMETLLHDVGTMIRERLGEYLFENGGEPPLMITLQMVNHTDYTEMGGVFYVRPLPSEEELDRLKAELAKRQSGGMGAPILDWGKGDGHEG